MKIGLIDVDGHNFPNLPLMKLSAWHKQQGDMVEWYEPLLHGFPADPLDKVYMSKVFGFTPDYSYYVNAKEVHKGGSGYCIRLVDGKEIYDKKKDSELPPEIETVYPDYSIHNKSGINGLEPWKPCGDYIDWSNLGKSIFDREKPLADATMRRIANGYVKYVVNNPRPYMVRNKEAVAFLIQYHGEQKAGDSRGQFLTDPIKTIDTSNRYGLVTAFITKFYKTGVGQGCDEPLHTITTSPGHFGLISAFLIKYYGTGCGQELLSPLGTITTKDRFGLVNVITDIDGENYILKDIFLRMLKPEELKLMQGFPEDYIIDRDDSWKRYPISEQVKRIGNSVVPIMAQKLVETNCSHMKVGERMLSINTGYTGSGQMRMIV